MSLSQLVLRHLTVLALLNKTLAGLEVKSSLLDPNITEDSAAVPAIAVFTDSRSTERGDIHGKDIIGGDSTVTLALEIACVAKAPDKDAEGGETFIPQTDEGMEMTLDLIERQAVVELQAGQSVWANLWRTFACEVIGLRAERGAAAEKGIRFAARRLEIQCKPLTDPVPGAPLPPAWEAVFAAFEGEDTVKKFAPLLRAAATGQPVPDWAQVQQSLGLALDEVTALGIVPMASEVPSLASEIVAEDDDLNVDIAVTPEGSSVGGVPTRE